MKRGRQEAILKLIQEKNIGTQEELAARLNEAGFKVTQATVSRDIRRMGLTKVSYEGGQKYVPAAKNEGPEKEKYTRVLRDGYVSMDMAQNILVMKTSSGMAMAVAAALDSMNFPEVVGCIAGDDTIFCAVRSVDETLILMDKISIIVK